MISLIAMWIHVLLRSLDLIEREVHGQSSTGTEVHGNSLEIMSQNGTLSNFNSKFDDKVEASSAKIYFDWYGQLLHQQNMLQDYVGDKHVYAEKASEMAGYTCKLIAGNPSLDQIVTIIKVKIEEVELPEKADILIYEPMGMLIMSYML
ncbi:probable histone-arginine methyltransferase 1.3 [Actinidia eriantha]|uniref:probable histone-arginine methyltransferase 1.3 n=1 Tax=Actinidia eriantha TaxID=165200 RepID=UPI00258480A9|nr:probable histone-arginine methyltransferase 1.3 [Actinidia eriantha]